MKIRICISIILLLLATELIYAQSATDIFLLDLRLESDEIEAKNPRNISQREGYDNQASFSPDSRSILYTSIREDQQADIYAYEISSGKTSRLTHTPETSEYSPQIMSGGKYFSVVRVEKDQKTQRLWRFSLKNGKAKLLMPAVEPVGYYTWYRPGYVAMFILGEPNTLKYTQVKKQALTGFDFELGRSVHTRPGTESVSFVDKTDKDHFQLKSWNSNTGEIEILTETLSEVEDYCWTPDGKILMGKDGHLFVFNPEKKEFGWKDLGNLGIGNFYRLACSPDGKFLTAVVTLAP